MRYEQPEMEILLFGAKVDTIIESNMHEEGDNSGSGGSGLGNGDGTWS